MTALLTSKILGFTVPSDPKPIWLVVLQWEAIAALDYAGLFRYLWLVVLEWEVIAEVEL
ncbi:MULTISPECIES: hypothetical protein [unclassified Nostoc]|uniref:hypothetical protein n=1 Tax=unclassified Nostoc TaxID=2593658 RepID=UPI00167550CB|nr:MULTISPECIES: hypothetical protein [unclassified Nostoc]MBN3906704.1 hypothetical protein [Nostoc sp. NMS1]MDZ8229284.1 hypothetical protein [Nostoc sp. ChiQUE02]